MITTAGITVTGTGTVSAVPDEAYLRVAADVKAPNVAAAMDQAAAALAAMRAALVDHGVDREDLRASNVSLDSTRFERPHRVPGSLRPEGHPACRRIDRRYDTRHADRRWRRHPPGGAVVRLRRPVDTAARGAGRGVRGRRRQGRAAAGLAGQTLGVVEAIDETPRHGHPAEVATIEAVSARTTPLEFDLGRQTVTAAVTVRWAWA